MSCTKPSPGDIPFICSRFQHLQNKTYAITKVITTTTKFQNPFNKKSTIIPTLNQKKAKPHTRFINSPCLSHTTYKTVYSDFASFVTIFYKKMCEFNLSATRAYTSVYLYFSTSVTTFETATSTSSVITSLSPFFWKRSIKSGTISKTFVTVS